MNWALKVSRVNQKCQTERGKLLRRTTVVKVSTTMNAGALPSRLQSLSPEETPVPGQTRDANIGGLELTLELEPAHQQALHPAKTCTPPSQTLLPSSFRQCQNTTADRETYSGLQDSAFRKDAAPKGFALPHPRDQGFSPEATGGIRREPRQCLREESGAHGHRRRRHRTCWAGFHAGQKSISEPESDQLLLSQHPLQATPQSSRRPCDHDHRAAPEP